MLYTYAQHIMLYANAIRYICTEYVCKNSVDTILQYAILQQVATQHQYMQLLCTSTKYVISLIKCKQVTLNN